MIRVTAYGFFRSTWATRASIPRQNTERYPVKSINSGTGDCGAKEQMATLPLKPSRGGFLRPFGCGIFIRDFLLGTSPGGSAQIDPLVGAPQAEMFREYKIALLRATAMDRAIKAEEKAARREKRYIDPDRITKLANRYLAGMPYKAHGCRFHSFGGYFSTIQKLRWVEFTGREEPSAFQDHYPPGPPRKYFRLTKAGREASDEDWANPRRALYGKK